MKPLKLNIQTFDGGPSATINVTYETNGHPKTTSVKAIVTCTSHLFGENNIPTGYTLTSSNVMEKTFTSNTTETITVECYTQGQTSGSFTQSVTVTVNQIGQTNTREVAYAFCGSKCGHEVYTKVQMDDQISDINTKLNEKKTAILTGTVTCGAGSKGTTSNIPYPTGFNYTNCIPIAYGAEENNQGFYSFGLKMFYVNLSNAGARFCYDFSQESSARTYNYKIVLMKIV